MCCICCMGSLCRQGFRGFASSRLKLRPILDYQFALGLSSSHLAAETTDIRLVDRLALDPVELRTLLEPSSTMLGITLSRSGSRIAMQLCIFGLGN